MKRLIIVLIGFTLGLSPIFGFSGATDLINIPTAETPLSGSTQAGVYSEYDLKNSEMATENQIVFLKYSFTDNISYSLHARVSNPSELRHDIHVKLLELYQAGGIDHIFGMGVKDIGWQDSFSTTRPIYDYYVVYTLIPLDSDFKFHLGAVRDITESDSTKLNTIAGLTYDLNWGQIVTDWDGYGLNLGVKVIINDYYQIFSAYTTDPYEQNQNYFRLGLSIIDVQEPYRKIRKDLEPWTRDKPGKRMVMDKSSKQGLYHIQKGLEYFYDENYQSALKEYKIVIALLPNFSLGYERLGSIYYKLGEKDKAIYYWKKAYEIDPKGDLIDFVEKVKKREI